LKGHWKMTKVKSSLEEKEKRGEFLKPDPLLSCNRILPGHGHPGPGDLRGAASRTGWDSRCTRFLSSLSLLDFTCSLFIYFFALR